MQTSPFPTIRLPLQKSGESTKADLIQKKIHSRKLHTVCEEAQCPNLGHCWNEGTATFLIMGDACTRRCTFCNIQTARPQLLDPNEPYTLAATVAEMNLTHVVITSVDRDDLPDCGAHHFATCVQEVRKSCPNTRIEVLIPDFKAKEGFDENLEKIWDAKPDIINHNIETVPSLYKSICPQCNYSHSLHVLSSSQKKGFITKSGIILGLGEDLPEVKGAIRDLADLSVSILTIGQYLAPSTEHVKVAKMISQEIFDNLRDYACSQGIAYVQAGPLVRSSYHAKESFEIFWKEKKQKDVH